MDKMRKFAKQLHEASAVAREKCEDTMEGVTDMAASGAGLAAEKAILLVATAMDEAIKALDQPFKDVGKDIFRIKEVEIIKCYMNIIENARIKDAQKAVR